MKKVIKILLFIIFLVVIIVFVLFLKDKNNSVNISVEPQVENEKIKKGFIEYKDDVGAFSLFYPEDMKVSEYDEGSNAKTIVFEDIKNDQGFQIFIVPYREKQITQERFLKDSLTGVMKESREIYIDSVLGNVFYGMDPILGETVEVWFINNGFLYEVTTLKSLENLLADIIGTWKFRYITPK